MALRIMRRESRGPVASALLATVLLFAQPAAAAEIVVYLDQAKLEKLPEKVATVVVGNPITSDL